MKKSILLLSLMLSSFSLSAQDKAELITNVMATMFAAFGGAEGHLGNADGAAIDRFIKAISAVKAYAHDNSKNLVGIKDSVLIKAGDNIANISSELGQIAVGIVGTRTENGLVQLRKMLDTQEEKLLQITYSLNSAGFTLSNKKNASELVSSAVNNLMALIGKARVVARNKIDQINAAQLGKPPLPPARVPTLPR